MRAALALLAALGVGSCALGASSIYIVDEGNIAVISHWGKAVGQEGPQGVQFRVPIRTAVEEFDVRETRLTVDMAAATQNQLPISAAVALNWAPQSDAVLDLFKRYGGPDRFATTIMQPRLIQAAKAGLAAYQADALIRDRTAAAATILSNMVTALESYPATAYSVQIENVVLPPRYMEAVLKKEEEREMAQQEKYRLDRQRYQAQQQVQTAEAARDASMAQADGAAYARTVQAKAEAEARVVQAKADAQATEAQGAADAFAIRVTGEAEAEAITLATDAMGDAPGGYPALVWARNWRGAVPSLLMGDAGAGQGLFFQMPEGLIQGAN